MIDAIIKCPYCGKESFVVHGDLNKHDLIYDCDKCHREFRVSFFDYCPKCHKNVGFLDNYGFKNDMQSFASDALNFIVSPLSLISTIGAPILESYSKNAKDATGDGECPICHNRYIRCCSCYKLISISKDANYKDIFRCHCGTAIHPNGTTDSTACNHSKQFRSFVNKSQMPIVPSSNHSFIPKDSSLSWLIAAGNSNDRKREKKKNQQQIQKKPKVTTFCSDVLYSQTDLLYIIADCENNSKASEDQLIVTDKKLLKERLESKYNIIVSMSQLNKHNTYKGLITYIIENTRPGSPQSVPLKDISKKPHTNCEENSVGFNECVPANTSNKNNISENEKEYIEEIRACLADGEIGARERRLLNKIREKLGISEDRAAMIEANLNAYNLTDEEQEYLTEFRECAVDGVISDKERRLLDKMRNMLGISTERAKELEQM